MPLILSHHITDWESRGIFYLLHIKCTQLKRKRSQIFLKKIAQQHTKTILCCQWFQCDIEPFRSSNRGERSMQHVNNTRPELAARAGKPLRFHSFDSWRQTFFLFCVSFPHTLAWRADITSVLQKPTTINYFVVFYFLLSSALLLIGFKHDCLSFCRSVLKVVYIKKILWIFQSIWKIFGELLSKPLSLSCIFYRHINWLSAKLSGELREQLLLQNCP